MTRRKIKKLIDKKKIIEIIKAQLNDMTNNPNIFQVGKITGYDRQTFARW